jgi:ATP phosphoribosyltransferase
MLVDADRLHIAIQKNGRLADVSRDLLKDAGLRLQNSRNALTARVENFPADLMFVRDDDIPTFVADGVCEFGIVGGNVLEEFRLASPEPAIEVVAPLGTARCSLKLAAPEATAWEGPQSLAGQRIATSYPAIVVKMNGAVELAPRLRIAPFICDLVSTGATLEANGLRPVADVFDSEAVLVRTTRPLSDDKRAQGEALLSRIQGVLSTKDAKYILLNAPSEALPAITRILPGAEAPTIIPLHGRPGFFAVHAVCQESVFWETLEELKGAGASAVLVLPIEKMML